MKYTIYNYRYAQEILEHGTFGGPLNEILTVINECPLYQFSGKSASNTKLDVVQQLLNAYFDVRLSIENKWDYHPNATHITGSKLAADFRKIFSGLAVQVEVQFGNMSRWYSDIFKFQSAFTSKLANIGICIVPMTSLAVRIDSNVTNFERCVRELPSAELSITLPVLVIGIEPDEDTSIIDVTQSPLVKSIKSITASKKNRYAIVNNLIAGSDISKITSESEVGELPKGIIEPDENDDEEEE